MVVRFRAAGRVRRACRRGTTCPARASACSASSRGKCCSACGVGEGAAGGRRAGQPGVPRLPRAVRGDGPAAGPDGAARRPAGRLGVGLTAGVSRDRPPSRPSSWSRAGKSACRTRRRSSPPGRPCGSATPAGSSLFLGRVGQTLTAGDGPFPLAGPGWLAAGGRNGRSRRRPRKRCWPTGKCGPPWTAFIGSFLAAWPRTPPRRSGRARPVAPPAGGRAAVGPRHPVAARESRGPAGGGRGRPETAEGGRPDEDPLLAACRLVGGRLGISSGRPSSRRRAEEAQRPGQRHRPRLAGARPARAAAPATGGGRTTGRCWPSAGKTSGRWPCCRGRRRATTWSTPRRRRGGR